MKSIFQDIDKDTLQKLCDTSHSYAEVIRSIGLGVQGSNFKGLHKRIRELGVDESRLNDNRNVFMKNLREINKQKSSIPLEEVISNRLPCSRSSLKKKLVKSGIIKELCSICNSPPFWFGKSLNLVLDHINGMNNDNRLENLRFLCPNCNSQQDTFCGANIKRVVYKCLDCGGLRKYKDSIRCVKCNDKYLALKTVRGQFKTKIEWPPLKELIYAVEKTSYSAVAKNLGVSDKSIKKHIEKQLKCRNLVGETGLEPVTFSV